MIFTHLPCNSRAALVERHTPAGVRSVLECSSCGTVAVEGFTDTGGMQAVHAKGKGPLQAGEFLWADSDLVVRPPRGPQLYLHGFDVKGRLKKALTVVERIDNGEWCGHLTAGVWIEEER